MSKDFVRKRVQQVRSGSSCNVQKTLSVSVLLRSRTASAPKISSRHGFGVARRALPRARLFPWWNPTTMHGGLAQFHQHGAHA